MQKFILLILVLSSVLFPQQRYFYTNKPYGSESLYNPLTLFINGGYDICQLHSISDKLSDHDYPVLINTVLKSIGSPLYSISRYGWNHIIRTELLPLSFTRNKMQWVPNLQNHLLGGGLEYSITREWYEEHGYPVPWLLSSVTVMGQHFMNEIMETGPGEEYSADEVIDLYIFDIGGIVLFSFDNINEFFSKTLNYSDWSLQATYLMPDGRIHAGQYFSMKWKIPMLDNYSVFYRYGLGGNFGLSYKVNDEDNLSVGVGFRTKHLVSINPELREKSIETAWQWGAFYDRNNSLMASLVMSGIDEDFLSMDVYPGIIKIGDFSPGVWSMIGRNGKFQMGISTRYVFSIGYSNRF